MKGADQLMTAGILELVAEALVLVEAHGVDPRAATQVWAAGPAGSRILEAKGEKMITRALLLQVLVHSSSTESG